MASMIAVLVASSQLLYQAQVQSFGCNTSGMISQLQYLRLDDKAFRALLAEKVALGDCVEFMKGSVVQASTVDVDPSVLRVQTEIDPPGYLAPSADFEPKEAGGEDEAK
jgi:hypothetical protein